MDRLPRKRAEAGAPGSRRLDLRSSSDSAGPAQPREPRSVSAERCSWGSDPEVQRTVGGEEEGKRITFLHEAFVEGAHGLTERRLIQQIFDDLAREPSGQVRPHD